MFDKSKNTESRLDFYTCASFESHVVVNTQTVERYLFINLFIILIYIAERSQMSILINFKILQHKRFDVNKEYFLRTYMTH